MPFNLRSSRHSRAAQVPLPHPVRATLISIALIVAGGWLAGGLPFPFTLPGTYSTWVPRALAATGALWCLVAGRRAYRAGQASGIRILAAKDSTVVDVPTDQIIANIRESLAAFQMSGPSGVPGEVEESAGDFNTDAQVEAVGAILGLRRLAPMFKSVRPYQVTIVPREDGRRPAESRKGLTISISGPLGCQVSVTSVWGACWREVSRRAANTIAAYLLPRTRLSLRAPWIPWRGVDLPPDLFYHFHKAQRLVREHRLEEALGHLDEAVARDPLNPYIRIEKGKVLDQLGLYLDALASYFDAMTIESMYERRLWRRCVELFPEQYLPGSGPGRFTRSPNGPAARQLARYRLVCSLAASGRLAEQWERRMATVAPLEQRKRAAEARHLLVSRLRPLLAAYGRRLADAQVDPHAATFDPATLAAKRQSWRSKLTAEAIEHDGELLRRVLQFAAMDEGRALVRDSRSLRSLWQRRKLPVSKATIRIIPVWVTLQCRYIETLQHRRGINLHGITPKPADVLDFRLFTNDETPAQHQRTTTRRLAGTKQDWKEGTFGWPPPPELIEEAIHQALDGVLHARGLRWLRSVPLIRSLCKESWHDHYNAACTFAVAMLTPELYRNRLTPTDQAGRIPADVDTDREAGEPLARGRRHLQLVHHAIDHLIQAVAASDSQFAAGASPWLRHGDPDLNELRVTTDYLQFIDHFLPEFPRPTMPPVNAALLVMSIHHIRLIRSFAAVRAGFWRDATAATGAELRCEAVWWQRLREYCTEYRDWRTRLALIRLGQSDPAGGAFSRMPTITTDRAWAELCERDSGQKPAAPPEALTDGMTVSRWIQVSHRRQQDAEQLISERNGAIDRLGRDILVRDGCPIDAVIAATSPPPKRIAAALAVAWDSIEAYMASLERQSPDASDEHTVAERVGALFDRVDHTTGRRERRSTR